MQGVDDPWRCGRADRYRPDPPRGPGRRRPGARWALPGRSAASTARPRGRRRRQHRRDELGAAAARPGHERHARWQFDRLQLRAQRRSDRRAVSLDPRRGGQLLLGRVICPGGRSSLQGQTHCTVAGLSLQAQHRGGIHRGIPDRTAGGRRLRPRSRALWGAGPLQPLRVATRRGHRLGVGAPRAGRHDQWDTARGPRALRLRAALRWSGPSGPGHYTRRRRIRLVAYGARLESVLG